MRNFRSSKTLRLTTIALLVAIAPAAVPVRAPAQASPAPQPAASARPPTIDDAVAAIAASAPAAMAYQGTPGLSIAITDRTHTIRILSFGYANVDAKAPVRDETRFAIGSITKSMTALALLQLHDAGKVDLDAPVTRYLPWFSIGSGGKPILIHQLLSHTAGIPDDFSLDGSYAYDLVTLRAAKTLFAPGTAWSYSNDGFATVGAVVAAVDGRSWADALQARVFDRLGMSGASPVMTPQTIAASALGYQLLENDRPQSNHPALVASPPIDFVDPAGSVMATPEDMARYMRFYLQGGKNAGGAALIAPATFAAMTHADRYNNGQPTGAAAPEMAEAPQYYRKYGFGLSIFDEGGDHLIGHTGGISGYTSCMQVNLTRGFGVIAMANLVESPLHPCAIMLYAMSVLRAQSQGKPLPPPWQAPDIARVANAGAYAGTYTSPTGTTLRVTADDKGHLTLADSGTSIALYPRGGDLFWADDPAYALYLLNFSRDKSGNVVEMNAGPRWFASARYHGPRTFTHPASWNALAGRYENTFWGQLQVTRVVIVKNTLTLDGTTPLRPRPDGTFDLDGSIVRFDAYAGKLPQRLSYDGIHLYRIDLP
jgi:CubicO group peptidase (beta-lactamase class C family)